MSIEQKKDTFCRLQIIRFSKGYEEYKHCEMPE